MNTAYIRDSALKVIGFIKTDDQGKQFAYTGGRMVGIYNPQLDKTFAAAYVRERQSAVSPGPACR